VKELKIDEEGNKYKGRDRPMMVSPDIHFVRFVTMLIQEQVSSAWRGDGEQLAFGTFNKLVMTIYTGDLAERGGWAKGKKDDKGKVKA
jgi:hypothetical protein